MAGYLLICAAVPEELAGVVRSLESRRSHTIGSRQVFSGQLKDVPTRLLVTGPGGFNAVQAITATIEHRRPQAIIMVGCSGAFPQSGLKVGDVAAATEEIDAHLGIEPNTPGAPPAPLPFPVLTGSGMEIRGRYPINFFTKAAAQYLEHWFQNDAIQVTTGPFVTVATVTASDQRAQWLFDAFAPVMENMEGAGAAHVAAFYNIPFLEIRCAGNLVGNRDRAAWKLTAAFDRCAQSILALTPWFKNLAFGVPPSGGLY